MPIEIRELYIKAVIDSGGTNSSGSTQGNSYGQSANNTSTSGEDMEQIVDLCVEKVLEILKEKMEP